MWKIYEQKRRKSQSDFQNIIVEIAETVRHSFDQLDFVVAALDESVGRTAFKEI